MSLEKPLSKFQNAFDEWKWITGLEIRVHSAHNERFFYRPFCKLVLDDFNNFFFT